MKIIYTSLLLIHLLIASISRGQGEAADTVRPGKGRLLTQVLKPGLRQYLVYFQDPRRPLLSPSIGMAEIPLLTGRYIRSTP
jgi:hypothetical protein